MGRLQTVGLLVVHSKLKEDRITWQLSGLERPKDVFHGWSTHLENVRVQSRTEKKSEAEGGGGSEQTGGEASLCALAEKCSPTPV